MVHLPDPRDIDRFLCRGREKFDLGFACDCPKGWCTLMNNPEGIQNPRVSAVLKSAGLADREVGLVAGDLWGQLSRAQISLLLFCHIAVLYP